MSLLSKTVADFEGPWIETDWNSGLIKRCKAAWNKPLHALTNEEIATLLRQKIGIPYLLPIAEDRLISEFDDDSEMFEGELSEIVADLRRKC